jgi:serine/threonine-protein kinase
VLEAGDRIAGYRVESVLGERTETGALYHARRSSDGEAVTLKVVAEHLARDRRFRRRFNQEAKRQAAVVHPALMPVLEVGATRDELFVTFGRVRRPNLADVLAEEDLEASRAVRLLETVAGGLDAAAAAGLVHRDLRPGTIWVGPRDEAVLADFGLGSAPASEHEINTLEIYARAEYISPEEVEGQQTIQQSNVYSLAAILVECLTGDPPYPEEGQVALLARHLYAPAPSLSKRRPELPMDLDGVIARALAKDPASRFASCGAFMAEVRRTLAEDGGYAPAPVGGDEPGGAATGTLAPPSTATVLAPAPARTGARTGQAAPPPRERGARAPTVTRRRRSRGKLLAAAVVLVAAVGAGGWVLAGGAREEPPAAPAPVRSAASPAVSLSYPASWEEVEPQAEVPGLGLADAVALAPRDAGAGQGLMAGRAPGAGAYLLRPALVGRLTSAPSLDDPVRLGRLEAFRHAGLRVAGYPKELTLYVVPSTMGVVTVACFAEPDAAERFLAECERVASTLRLEDGRPYPLAPDPAYGRRVSRVVGRLNVLRDARRERFGRAVTPRGQADAAAGVARAYGAAADALVAAPPERGPEARANQGIVRALREAQRSYSALAGAARTNDRPAFNSARAAVRRAEGEVDRALRGLEAFGYTLR